MKADGIKWDKMALQFLRLHGWKHDKDNPYVGELTFFHPCFPLGEDFTHPDNEPLKFVEEFYGEAWKTHRGYVETCVMLSESKDPDDVADALRDSDARVEASVKRFEDASSAARGLLR